MVVRTRDDVCLLSGGRTACRWDPLGKIELFELYDWCGVDDARCWFNWQQERLVAILQVGDMDMELDDAFVVEIQFRMQMLALLRARYLGGALVSDLCGLPMPPGPAACLAGVREMRWKQMVVSTSAAGVLGHAACDLTSAWHHGDAAAVPKRISGSVSSCCLYFDMCSKVGVEHDNALDPPAGLAFSEVDESRDTQIAVLQVGEPASLRGVGSDSVWCGTIADGWRWSGLFAYTAGECAVSPVQHGYGDAAAVPKRCSVPASSSCLYFDICCEAGDGHADALVLPAGLARSEVEDAWDTQFTVSEAGKPACICGTGYVSVRRGAFAGGWRWPGLFAWDPGGPTLRVEVVFPFW